MTERKLSPDSPHCSCRISGKRGVFKHSPSKTLHPCSLNHDPLPTSNVLRFPDARASSKDKCIWVLSREPVVVIKFATRKHNGNTIREGHIVTFLTEGHVTEQRVWEFQPVLVHCTDQWVFQTLALGAPNIRMTSQRNGVDTRPLCFRQFCRIKNKPR